MCSKKSWKKKTMFCLEEIFPAEKPCIIISQHQICIHNTDVHILKKIVIFLYITSKL